MAKEKAVFTPEQGKRIADAVKWTEKFKHQRRPQPIRPRFTGGPSVPGLLRFQLEEDLTTATGGHCEARLLKLSHPNSNTFIVDEDKDPIEVYDWYRRNSDYPEVDSPGMWFGKAGYRGYCIKRANSGSWTDTGESGGSEDDVVREKYDIVWMEQIAERIMFSVPTGNRLDSSSGTTVLSVDVIRYDGQGIHPTATFESVGEELVLNVPFFFSDVVEGSYGFAEYDYTEGKYYIVECTRIAMLAKAQLTANMCGNESSIGIDNFSILSHGDFVLNPETAPTIAYNPYAHAGPDNSAVLLVRIGQESVATGAEQPWRWDIIDIAKRETNIITDLYWGLNESVENSIQYKERTLRAEWCDPETEPDWQTLVVASNCTGDEP